MIPLILALLVGPSPEAPAEVVCRASDRTGLALTLTHDTLGIVEDLRRLRLPAGSIRLAFEDLPPTLHPASVLMAVEGATVRERNVEAALIARVPLLRRHLGQEATFRLPSGELAPWERLASIPTERIRWAPWRTPWQRLTRTGPTLSRPDPDVLLQGPTGFRWMPGSEVVLRPDTAGLRLHATLLADLTVAHPREVEARTAYLADGFSWYTTYLARLSPDARRLTLDAWVTLTNRSGLDFRDARLQLLAGRPNQVDDPPMLPSDEPVLDKTDVRTAAQAGPSFTEERVSEYPLYTLSSRTTLLDQQTKQIALFSAPDLPVDFEAYAVLDPMLALPPASLEEALRTKKPHPDGVHVLTPQLVARILNRPGTGPGRALPEGTCILSQAHASGTLLHVGESSVEATAVGENLEIPIDAPLRHLQARHQVRLLKVRPAAEGLLNVEVEGQVTLDHDPSQPMPWTLQLDLGTGARLRSSTLQPVSQTGGTIRFRIPATPAPSTRFTYRARVRCAAPVQEAPCAP